jgi:hypothetical protein
LITV